MAALIKVGSLHDFSIAIPESVREILVRPERIFTVGPLTELRNDLPPESFDYLVTQDGDRRGLALQSLQLKKEFQNFIARLFQQTSNIYFLAWAWDMGSLHYYPGKDADASSCLIPLKGGELREFIHSGALLFPPRPITAGLALRIQIWESRQGLRDFGRVMAQVAGAIQDSNLNKVLLGLAVGSAIATGGAAAALAAVEPAALDLARRVGDILKAAHDDVVDFFEGYFPASDSWSAGPETYGGRGSTIILNRLN